MPRDFSACLRLVIVGHSSYNPTMSLGHYPTLQIVPSRPNNAVPKIWITAAVYLLWIFFAFAPALTGCGGTVSNKHARIQLDQTEAKPPVPEAFNYCYGHGCKNLVTTGLTVDEWRNIQRLFDPPASDPGEERQRLAAAVGRFETYVGAKLGTGVDLGGTFQAFGDEGQLDCVDEATNTTTFLRMLEHDKRLKWFSVGTPVSRGMLISGWPHSTATIAEIKSGRQYAVDSWFFDNGMNASVISLESWMAGWTPE